MLATETVDEIRTLLGHGGLSQRKIAQCTGVSRGTVSAIARGKRADYNSAGRSAREDFVAPSGRPVRCRGCGGLVQMPCLLCQVRAIKQQGRTENWD